MPPGPSAVAAGSTRCPWTVAVDRRQGLRVVLYSFGQAQTAASPGDCLLSAVFDYRVEHSLCPQRTHAARKRLLHSTDSNELKIAFKTAAHDDRPATPRQMNFYLLHYEGWSFHRRRF